MTAETSNARGEVVAWEARDPDDGTRWVTRHASERDGWMGLGRTIRPLIYGDAPPPAAARGDVRGLRRPSDAAIAAAFWEHRARENSIPAELCDAKLVQFGHEIVSRARVLEPSLAAEGVQAGEVEQRARELVNSFDRQHDKTFPFVLRDVAIQATASALSQQPEARVYQCPRCATSMEVDPTAKPEARGVVDELRRTVAAIGVVGEYLGKDTILRESVLDLIDRRLTALTEARNVR